MVVGWGGRGVNKSTKSQNKIRVPTKPTSISNWSVDAFHTVRYTISCAFVLKVRKDVFSPSALTKSNTPCRSKRTLHNKLSANRSYTMREPCSVYLNKTTTSRNQQTLFPTIRFKSIMTIIVCVNFVWWLRQTIHAPFFLCYVKLIHCSIDLGFVHRLQQNIYGPFFIMLEKLETIRFICTCCISLVPAAGICALFYLLFILCFVLGDIRKI